MLTSLAPSAAEPHDVPGTGRWPSRGRGPQPARSAPGRTGSPTSMPSARRPYTLYGFPNRAVPVSPTTTIKQPANSFSERRSAGNLHLFFKDKKCVERAIWFSFLFNFLVCHLRAQFWRRVFKLSKSNFLFEMQIIYSVTWKSLSVNIVY